MSKCAACSGTFRLGDPVPHAYVCRPTPEIDDIIRNIEESEE